MAMAPRRVAPLISVAALTLFALHAALARGQSTSPLPGTEQPGGTQTEGTLGGGTPTEGTPGGESQPTGGSPGGGETTGGSFPGEGIPGEGEKGGPLPGEVSPEGGGKGGEGIPGGSIPGQGEGVTTGGLPEGGNPGVEVPKDLGPVNATAVPSASSGGVAVDLPEVAFEGGMQKELPCLPEDFVRSPGQCSGDKMVVTYNTSRTCSLVFDRPSHEEPCGCRPEDLTWSFSRATDASGEEQCMQIYKCGSEELGKVRTELLHCANNLPACTEDYLLTMYGKCDDIRDKKTGQKISDKQAVEVIYYFGADCDPAAHGSVRPPASAFIPCDTSCGAGSYLKGTQCKKCDAGTYSLGGVVRYDRFESIDPAIFKTRCTYKTLVPGTTTKLETKNCTQGWYAEDNALEVGQFDYVNQWFPDECEADTSKDCHNNLEAVISTEVILVTDGYVKFNFSVNAEKGHDGLSFFVDTFERPIMGLQSFSVVPRSVFFPLTTGRHQLYWLYSKDGRFTQGEDIAVIHSIEIAGMALNAFWCQSCPPGYSSTPGSQGCTPCPVNKISTQLGAAACTPCNGSEFAVATPRTKCLPRQPCNMTRDYVKIVSGCNPTTQKQSVSYRVIYPQVCSGGDVPPPPQEVPCEECKPGFEKFMDPARHELRCRECPPGFARSGSQTECTPCPLGQYAAKTWSLQGYDVHSGHYPPFVTSYCHGSCGTSGWRIMSDFMDSGKHHGDGTQVFLILHAYLDYEGSVTFNYSVDMSAGSKKRGFFFYIDDNIMDFVQDDEGGSIEPDTVRESGPWDLTPGRHRIVWEWMRISDDAPAGARDNALIYDIVVKGSKIGYSDGCEPIPAGYYINQAIRGIQKCPPGNFSTGGSTVCQQCPENTFSQEGASECTPCGTGTSSTPGSSECFIGSANDPASFCSFFDTSNAPESFENVTEVIEYYFYDLSPLHRLSLVHPFGPIHSDTFRPGSSSMYYINICNRDATNATCKDLEGKSLNTFACLVHAEEEQQVGHRPAVDLGKKIELHSLAEEGKGLGGRGVRLRFEGESCPKTSLPRTLNVTLICSPQSGYGLPTFWTTDGKRAAFDLSLKRPREWVVRTGEALPMEDPDTCHHDLVWYSEIGCHECTWSDYEEVRVNDCKENKMYTYRWKQDLACLPTDKAPLPADILCQPCTENDYEEITGTCADMMGNHNRTYRWTLPKVCSSFLEGAVPLPASVAAGPCIQEFLFVPSSVLSPKYVFLFALLSVLLVVMFTIWLVAYIKHRRIQRFYSKLVQTEDQMQEMADLDDDDDDLANGEQQQLSR